MRSRMIDAGDAQPDGGVAAGETLEVFVRALVHDLRSPLVTVESMLSLLAESAGERLERDERAYLEHIETSVKVMQSMLVDLSDLVLIPEHVPDLASVSLQDLARELDEQFRPRVEEVGGVLHVGSDMPAVLGETTLIRTALTRCLENGIKFREPDRKLKLGLLAATAGPDVEIRIEDNGIGIAPRFQDRIFGVFNRLHPRSRYGGNGIGLAVAKRCVESLGGSIQVESVQGEGCCFRIRFRR